MTISERLFRLAQNGRYTEALAAVKAYRNDETTPPEDVWLYKIIFTFLYLCLLIRPWRWTWGNAFEKNPTPEVAR